MNKEAPNPKIINIGCGRTKIPGVIGLDQVSIDGYVDIVHDLDNTPYPFEDSSVDEIHMYHVLEHLTDPISKLEDLHRILKPDGVIHIRVPHFSSMGAFTDLTHVRPFGYMSFDCFEKDNYHHFYTSVKFEIIHKEIKYFGLYPNTGLYAQYIHPNQCHPLVKPFVRIINWTISLSPTIFERIWCYWVGGATEIVIDMKAIK
jgi:SAM-dependent methyltransferase